MKNTFERDNLFEVPEVKKDDITEDSSSSGDLNDNISCNILEDSSDDRKKLRDIKQFENNCEDETPSNSEESDGIDENVMLGYLSDENESNAKNIRRNT